MSFKNVFVAALAALVLASCSAKVADKTEISGTVVPEGVSEVNIT